jgi:hypothetical protein
VAIVSGDILRKFSVKTGAAGNSTAGNAAGSLGKYISTTAITDASLHNLFDVITGDENAASNVEYRIIFFHNAHASLTYTAPVVWLSAEGAGGAAIAIAVDNAAASAIGSASAQADELADEDTAPDSVGAFSSPTTKGTGLALGDIAAGSCRAICIRRTAANTAAVDNDDVHIDIEGDTSA